MSQAAEFATSRPSHWQELAAEATQDFVAYLVFVRQLYPSECHLVIAERLVYGDDWELILGPPGCGKSTIVNAYQEWTLGRDPNYRWLNASEKWTGRAKESVLEIRDTIAENERYHMCFGNLKGDRWNAGSITLRKIGRGIVAPPFPWLVPRGRHPRLVWPSVSATSAAAGTAGLRADGLVFDDLTSDRSAMSQDRTEHIFRSLHQKMIPRLSSSPKRRRVIGLGQRYMPRDLYGLLMENGMVVYDSNPELEGIEILEAAA